MVTRTDPLNLYGERPFFRDENYRDQTWRDFARSDPLPPDTWSLTAVVARCFLSPPWTGLETVDDQRRGTSLNGNWKYKRFAIETAAGDRIDCCLAGTERTLQNRRWVLYAPGAGQTYESILTRGGGTEFFAFPSGLNANVLFFNYPGIGASTGHPSERAMIMAHQAALRYLVNPDGIGATDVVPYGYSLGGAVQIKSVANLPLSSSLKVALVTQQTFCSIDQIAWYGCLAAPLGWTMSPLAAAGELTLPHFVLQTATTGNFVPLSTPDAIVDDGVFSPEQTLGYRLLEERSLPQGLQVLGITERHQQFLQNGRALADRVDRVL